MERELAADGVGPARLIAEQTIASPSGSVELVATVNITLVGTTRISSGFAIREWQRLSWHLAEWVTTEKGLLTCGSDRTRTRDLGRDRLRR